ncbi:MAG: hypothetical protein GY756_23635 [bacterium]|nr:hypothetical protein [bacterium]
MLNLYPLTTAEHRIYNGWWNSLKGAIARDMGLSTHSQAWKDLMRGKDNIVIH